MQPNVSQRCSHSRKNTPRRRPPAFRYFVAGEEYLPLGYNGEHARLPLPGAVPARSCVRTGRRWPASVAPDETGGAVGPGAGADGVGHDELIGDQCFGRPRRDRLAVGVAELVGLAAVEHGPGSFDQFAGHRDGGLGVATDGPQRRSLSRAPPKLTRKPSPPGPSLEVTVRDQPPVTRRPLSNTSRISGSALVAGARRRSWQHQSEVRHQ